MVLERHRGNVLTAARISLIGAIEAGSDLGFDCVDLIGAISYQEWQKSTSHRSQSSSSDTALDLLSTQAPTEHPTNSRIEESPLTALDGHKDLNIYRFSDQKVAQNKDTKCYNPDKKLYKVPTPSDGKDVSEDSISTSATKTWVVNQSAVLLNINNERVDADLGPIDPEADRNLLSRMKRRKICHNYVLLGHCAQAGACPFAHVAGLDEKERIALVYRARRLLCTRGSQCRSTKCWYGHTCMPNCKQGFGCFKKLHHVDRTAVTVWQSGSH